MSYRTISTFVYTTTTAERRSGCCSMGIIVCLWKNNDSSFQLLVLAQAAMSGLEETDDRTCHTVLQTTAPHTQTTFFVVFILKTAVFWSFFV